jgi:Kef-type K+ transport system membrane component KefB
MGFVSTELLLIILCGLVVLSYLFSIISQFIRIPSVLLLLFAGMGFRLLADAYGIQLSLPPMLVEGLGVVGLIMIILEAGLDLKLGKEKTKLVRDSFLSALIILLISSTLITAILYLWLNEDVLSCVVYALPLSIMSSSITIPSIHNLTQHKKEFLIYEASFSDIIGILLFNYFVAPEILTLKSVGLFGFNIIVSVLLSIVISFVLFLILARTKLNVKFFLIFSLLIVIYSGGKMLHLPSLLIILVFGMVINNWEKIPLPGLLVRFPQKEVAPLRELLHSITAESSFLIRTFFFILFGYTIDVSFLNDREVIWVGSLIVLSLFLIRLVYLKFYFRTRVVPEVFFIPRGLITIVLFFKIPEHLKLASFNDGILFFVILSTSLILSLGMVLYRQPAKDIVEEPQFSERSDIL